jgi:hypothetical protein
VPVTYWSWTAGPPTVPDEDTIPDLPPPGPIPRRAARRIASRRRRQLTLAAGLLLLSLAALLFMFARDGGQRPTMAHQVPTSTRPRACAQAMTTAARLATQADLVAEAAGRHLKLMKRLDLFLEGKPGGLSGHEVYQQGETQMAVFEQHGPAVRRLAHQYREVAAECPSK